VEAGRRAGITFNRGVSVYPALGDRVRVASRHELEQAFCGDRRNSVRIGCIRQDPSISATIRVDDLLGKHFAVLGTTGTGKSCTTALILRAILQKHPAAHMVLLDPHNEYAPAFGESAEVISQRNMQLPYWLLTFEELIEVLIGNPQERKAEVELLQDMIPVAKARYGAGRGNAREAGLRPRLGREVHGGYAGPLSHLGPHPDHRRPHGQAREQAGPVALPQPEDARLETISLDPRYAFMFGSLTVYDSMARSSAASSVCRSTTSRSPSSSSPACRRDHQRRRLVLCRMTFDFGLWSEGQVPVTLVCEEAHRYVPGQRQSRLRALQARHRQDRQEGRKYGASLCIVTQRPAEIDPTILSQCNTVFALRMSNDRDQEIVKSAISDTGAGLLEFLTALGQREAIAFGDGVTLPVRIKFDDLPRHCLPRSSTARFTEKWQKSVGDEGFLEAIVDRWRNSSSTSAADAAHQVTLFAEAMSLHNTVPPRRPCGAEHPRAHDADQRARARGRRALHPPRAAGCTGSSRCEPPARQRTARHPRPPAAALRTLPSLAGRCAEAANARPCRHAPHDAPVSPRD
jgi:hypothetical protein